MRITENQLRRIVRSIIREGADIDQTLKNITQDNYFSYDDPKEIAIAYKKHVEDALGAQKAYDNKDAIEDLTKSLEGSLGSMTKNYADKVKVKAPEDEMQAAKEPIETKIKAYIERAMKLK